jgi:hypothetical protein
MLKPVVAQPAAMAELRHPRALLRPRRPEQRLADLGHQRSGVGRSSMASSVSTDRSMNSRIRGIARLPSPDRFRTRGRECLDHMLMRGLPDRQQHTQLPHLLARRRSAPA